MQRPDIPLLVKPYAGTFLIDDAESSIEEEMGGELLSDCCGAIFP
jgi:hypothetical protein